MKMSLFALSLGFCLFGAACTVGPDYTTPKSTLPETFNPPLPTEAQLDQPGPLPETWWELLNDPTLTDLIQSARKANLDIRIAQARLQESRAGRKAAQAGFYPTVGLGATVRRQRQSENSPSTPQFPPGFPEVVPESTLYQIGFDAAWEIDIFGGTRRAAEAADARVELAQAGRDEVLRIVLAEVVLNYVELRGLQKRKAVLQRNIQVQRDTLLFTENRLSAGLGTELDVSQARAQLISTEATLPRIQAGVQFRIFQIAALLGEEPRARLEQLTPYAALQPIPEQLFNDIPSEVLRRRPDVQLAERRLAAEVADIGVATADLFPRFALLGGGGWESAASQTLLTRPSGFGAIGPSVNWPLFQGGRIRANIAAQQAQSEAALADYEKAILKVLQEVNNALVDHGHERATAQLLRAALKASQDSVKLSTTLYQEGLSDILTVLNTESLLLRVEDEYAQTQTREWTSLIRLYKALGGGWQVKSS